MTTNSLFGMQVRSVLRLGACAAALALSGCGAPPEEMSEGEVEADDTGSQGSALSPGMGVSSHGWLKTVGNQIQDAHGAQVQLKGMSLFWSQWSGSFYNASVVNTLADSWNANLVRAAMAVEHGGYLSNPAAEKARVKTIVDAAIAKDIYVIIDWHDHNATQHTPQAVAFFTEMANLYKTRPNVIFEIFNEPDDESWPQVKSYAQQVIAAIRGTGAQNLIVVGTPTWSQDVDVAAGNPITGYPNIAYTLHFYAGTHKQSLRDKASTALAMGAPLFVTEFGTCDASGNGGLDLNESQTWINFLNDRKISWANWSLFDKNETASVLVPGSSTTGSWTAASLTPSGAWVKQRILEGTSPGGGDPPPPPPPPPGSFQFTVSPNINPWWIQVKVSEAGHTVTSVTAKVNGNVYPLTLQTWGEWTTSPPAAVPGGTSVLFTAKDESNNTGTFTSQPWPY